MPFVFRLCLFVITLVYFEGFGIACNKFIFNVYCLLNYTRDLRTISKKKKPFHQEFCSFPIEGLNFFLDDLWLTLDFKIIYYSCENI